jgi:hypothetical protein
MRFLQFLNFGLTERVGEGAATALIIGIPAIVIGIVAWPIVGDLGEAAVIGFVGSLLLAIGLMGAMEGVKPPR